VINMNLLFDSPILIIHPYGMQCRMKIVMEPSGSVDTCEKTLG
jgi:hypothetical protein